MITIVHMGTNVPNANLKTSTSILSMTVDVNGSGVGQGEI